MKWFRKSIGPLTLSYMGETIHTGIGFRLGCGVDIDVIALAFLWRGITKWKIYTKLNINYDRALI